MARPHGVRFVRAGPPFPSSRTMSSPPHPPSSLSTHNTNRFVRLDRSNSASKTCTSTWRSNPQRSSPSQPRSSNSPSRCLFSCSRSGLCAHAHAANGDCGWFEGECAGVLMMVVVTVSCDRHPNELSSLHRRAWSLVGCGRWKTT